MPGRGIRLNWNAAILVVLVWISQCLVPWESYAARFYGLNSSGDVRVINSSTGEIIAGLNTDLWSSGSIAFIPEPSTGLLLATGILGLALRRRSH